MGFSLRKSIKLGKNTKLNLSGSGVSISTGVKGARVVHRLFGRRASSTTLYAQRKVLGTDVRYIKSLGGTSGKEREGVFDFEDFHTAQDAEDFEDYLNQPTDNSGYLQRGGERRTSDMADVEAPLPLPDKPGAIRWGWVVVLTLFTAVGGIIYIVVKVIQGSDQKRIEAWKNEVKRINEENAKRIRTLEDCGRELREAILETTQALNENYPTVLQGLEDFGRYVVELEGRMRVVGSHLVPSAHLTEVERYYEFIGSVKSTSRYDGCIFLCRNCAHMWTVKKDVGQPPFCPSCRSKEIRFDGLKSFEKLHGVKISVVNEHEIKELRTELGKLEELRRYVQESELLTGESGAEELEMAIRRIGPSLLQLRASCIQALNRLTIR